MIPVLQPLIDALLAATPEEAAAAWPKGPTPSDARGKRSVPWIQYVNWVVQVEQSLPDRQPNEILRRVRRMHYSKFSIKVDRNENSVTSQNIDSLIGTTSDNPEDEPPLIVSPALPQAVLDGLYSTETIVTPAGHWVDIRHALNIMDFAYNGMSFGDGFKVWATQFLPGYSTVDASVVFASLGCIGDLGSVWNSWMNGRAARYQPATLAGTERANFEQVMVGRCSRDDLLGDIDGAVMATMSHHEPLSARLTAYYAGETSSAALNASVPNARQRFHYFVDRSVPILSQTVLTTTPLRVRCNKESVAAVEEILKALAGAIWRRNSDVAKALPGTHDPIFRELGNRVIRWIQDGLSDPNCGVPAWPNPPASVAT